MNIGIIGDTHEPFSHKEYFDFCYDTFLKYKCKVIVHIGDVADFHAISRHPHNPDGFSPKEELDETIKKLKIWYTAFPKCLVCVGNHDERIEKAAWQYGLSLHYFKTLTNILQFPKGWEYAFDHYAHGVRFFHGIGYSGDQGHVKAARNNQCSVVIGHIHSVSGAQFLVNERTRSFGMAVGCGIDRHSYAFNYGRDFAKKPIISCGVVLDNGKIPIVVPMDI